MAELEPDTDLIARLFPHDPDGIAIARQSIKHHHNKSRLVEARLPSEEFSVPSPPQVEGSHHKPASTEPSEESTDQDYTPCLELSFTHGAWTKHGVVFGTDPTKCDIVLPMKKGVSSRHCALTFEKNFQDCHHYRLVLRDLGSTTGTAVAYDGEGGERRTNFRWILSGHEGTNKIKSIVIYIGTLVEFRIVVAPHDITSQAYTQKVENFREGTARAEDSLLRLRLQTNPLTIMPTQAKTPHMGPIRLIREELGRGAFGTVSKIWDVSTGGVYAAKTVINDTTEQGTLVRNRRLREEMETLRSLRHDRVVRYIDWYEDGPINNFVLVMELYKLGSLHDAAKWDPQLSRQEIVQVLKQTAEGLVYLHGRDVTHRDLKPANIVVRRRNPLEIALTDFGIAKSNSAQLKAVGGTSFYLAPELMAMLGSKAVDSKAVGSKPLKRPGQKPAVAPPTYTNAVDIWALGVTGLALMRGARGLPTMTKDRGDYPQKIVDRVTAMWAAANRQDGLVYMIRWMVASAAENRPDAKESFEMAESLLNAMSEDSAVAGPLAVGVAGGAAADSPSGFWYDTNITDCDDTTEDDTQTTVHACASPARPAAEDNAGEGQHTEVLATQPRADGTIAPPKRKRHSSDEERGKSGEETQTSKRNRHVSKSDSIMSEEDHKTTESEAEAIHEMIVAQAEETMKVLLEL